MDDMGNSNKLTELGTIHIAPQVIETIAKSSTLDVEGVAGFSGGFTGDIAEFFGRNKSTTKGIKIEVGQLETAIDISLVIKYGYSILELAEKIQNNVKYEVENMAGLNVVEVNVHINGIEIDEKV